VHHCSEHHYRIYYQTPPGATAEKRKENRQGGRQGQGEPGPVHAVIACEQAPPPALALSPHDLPRSPAAMVTRTGEKVWQRAPPHPFWTFRGLSYGSL
jgi:hypothetical protein